MEDSVKCPACETTNRTGDAFCRQCGTPLTVAEQPDAVICAQCRTSSQAGKRFCRQCGAPLTTDQPPLPTPATAIEGERLLSAAVRSAEKALRRIPSAERAAGVAALRTVQARLDAGRRALAGRDARRAKAVLTGPAAQQDVETLRREITSLKAQQQRAAQMRENLERLTSELEARLRGLESHVSGLEVDTSVTQRRLRELRAKLRTSDRARKRGKLAEAEQILASVQAVLDALESEQMPKLREAEAQRQQLGQRLSQQGASLSAALQAVNSRLSALAHADATRAETSVRALSSSVQAGLRAHRSGDYSQAQQRFGAAEQALGPLHERVAALESLERHLGELKADLERRHEQYQVLQARISLLDDPALATERGAVERAVALLADLNLKQRLSAADSLEAALAQVEEPDRVQARVAVILGSPAPRERLPAADELAPQLSDLQQELEMLKAAIQNAEEQGVLVVDERQALEEWQTALGRTQAATERGALEEAWTALAPLDGRRVVEVRERLERRTALAESLQLKTTLSVARVSSTGQLNRYNVILNISGTGWGDAGSIKGNIKVGYKDRIDMRQAIDDLTTVINLLFGAQGSLRGRKPEITDGAAIDSLAGLGDMMYGLFLPSSVQEHLREARTSVLLATDDLELPWELLHTGEEFLCLRNPVGRMPIMNRFPRRNPYQRRDCLKFLFVANPTGDLPASEREVDHIVAQLGDVDATVWKGADVTNLKLYQALRSGEYDVIHYSGHAFYNRAKPDEGGLVLADQSVFIADTIKRMLRGRPLIFLNACESGREMMTDGEVTYTGSDNEGLALSFVLGGALGFIGTLWPIFDEGAAQFAAVFYEHLLGGEMIGEAMRQARLRVRQDRPNDVTWASFILYGDPTLRIIEREES